MPEISISREQEAYIEALRDELDDEVAYGHVRVQDAVQYLVDHHREDGELDIQVTEVPAPEEGDDGDDGGANAGGADGEGGSNPGSDASADPDDGESDDGESDGTTDASVDDTVEALGDAGPGGGSPGSSGANGDGGDDAGTAEASGETIGSAGSEMVDEMMNLIDAHDDVWEETESSEGKYRVELPEGGSETVPTKDDVRALLFKHYR